MKPAVREALAGAAPAVLLLAALGGAIGVLMGTAEPAEREALWAVVEPRVALVLMVAAVLALGAGVWMQRLWRRDVGAAGRLAEALRAAVDGGVDRALPLDGGADARALAEAANALLQERSRLRADVEARVQAGSRAVEQERSRLAALMAELTQSVVVCNLDGRVLLYNQRARLQFRALSAAPQVAGGAELIGLGRSIYAVLDRQLVAHALESVQQRLKRGAASPSAQFVTGTRGGQLLRVQMAPVRVPQGGTGGDGGAGGAGSDDASGLAGFVLMLDNITRDFADETERDRMLHELTERSRASLGTVQAAVELLDDPALDAPTRERFQRVVRDEVAAMSARIQALDERTTQAVKTRWPLEDMLGADLVAAAQRRIEAAFGCRTSADEVDAGLWLKVDSFSLLQALAALAGRLVEEYDVKLVRLRLSTEAGRARLDLVWAGHGLSTETVINWETEPMRVGSEASPLSVRDVVERHAGAFWFERERVRHEAFFRFLLPLAAEAGEALDEAMVGRIESRPEYYDFDLFQAGGDGGALADRPLSDLRFTVFDCETTGLDPSGGDEILQIGATRIVAGKLRRQECFEQLVDPQRSIPAASIPIHGIDASMVAGQPVIDAVLPAFHAFAEDTVLVAHNAAFDLRFLQLKEERTGVRFEQPVLDTLLLSAVVHPRQASHGLEAIAERLGVPVLGRHTALGDAMVTAEVFLKLLPLLEAQGIRTLRQALDAARQTHYARLQY